MINTEFRISNYVLTNGKIDQISKVTSFSVDVFKCKDMIISIDPIPIDEEWLLKFGFEKLTNQGLRYFKQLNRQGFRVVPSEYNDETIITPTAESEFFVTYECDISCGFNLLCYFESVHQLQNLYFALTGEELIKEL